MPKPDNLTEKQYQFTLNYVKNGYNASAAALASGYSKQFAQFNASKLLNNPIIFKRLTEVHKLSEFEKMEELKIAASDIAKKLLRIVEDVMPEEGEIKRSHYRHALAALEMLNKMHGNYAPARTFSVNVDATSKRLKDARQAYDEY